MKKIQERAAAHLAQLMESVALLDGKDRTVREVQEATDKTKKTLLQIGTPRFNDDAAIEKLAKLKLKLSICEHAMAPAEEELAKACHELGDLIRGCADFVEEVLRPSLSAVLAKMGDSMAPFYSERAAADAAAHGSDAGRTAIFRVRRFSDLANQALCEDAERMRVYAAPFIEVLKEASKDSPDFTRFFPVL